MSVLTSASRLAVGLLLSFGIASAGLADEIEGTWRLVKRQLPDCTRQTPPAVAWLATLVNGQRHLNVFWRTPDGKPASFGLVSKITVGSNRYTETLVASALDDGSGKPVSYNFSGETKSTPITRDGSRMSYQLPFDPPSIVIEGDELVATLDGVFVDYWEKIK